jgi:hypothetical protein
VPDVPDIPTCAGPGSRKRCVNRKCTPYIARISMFCMRYECWRGVWRALAYATAEEVQKTGVCSDFREFYNSTRWAVRACCCTREQSSMGPPRSGTVFYEYIQIILEHPSRLALLCQVPRSGPR